MTNNNKGFVSEYRRRENNKAIYVRDEWREKYKALSDIISDYKYMRDDRRTKDSDLILRTLQNRATVMLQERESISIRLRNTSYSWV
jgi:hypothetical protein